MNMLVNRFVLCSLALLFITACGQKGPLFLPGNPSEIRTPVDQQQPEQQALDDNQDKDKDKDKDEVPKIIQH